MKKTVSTVSLLLAALMLVGSLGIFSAYATQESAKGFDFSAAGSSYCAELTPSELLSLISPDAAATDAEKRYIDSYSECFFFINDTFSNDVTDIVRDNDKITVTAREYS